VDGVCVLLVEDEPLIREIMTEYLQDAGYEVVDVENGQSAVELLRAPSKLFSILVTDFHMPGDIDGSQVAQYVREAFPAIPVVIASGRPEVLKNEWRINLGYILLKKPYLPSELVKIVTSLALPTKR
jgi:CheY-like chemotaxis protein